MATRILRLFGLVAGLGLISCGGSHGPTLVPASANQQQNVMVVDEGFDVSVAELRGRVAAAYTESCVDTSGSGAGPAGDAGVVSSGPAFDALKRQLIAALSVPDDSCHLSVGISPKSDPLASIAPYKTRWNAMVRANQQPNQVFTPKEIAALQTALNSKEMQTFPYHGTATSGTVAYDNPNVRLVLVERTLKSESDLQAQFTCLVQSEFDQIVALLTDSDVFKALVNQPVTIESELAAVAAQYNVGIVNQSFGAAARVTLEMLQTQSGCSAPINLSAYFAILNKADLAHAAAGPALLAVQAAGNEGTEIDSGADSLECAIGDPRSLLVGSYDTSQVRSTFSNFGACVDLYAPGESIIAPYAGDWLLWVDGTSFASPMVARYLSLTAAVPFSPGPAKAALLGQCASDGSLPLSLFPNAFFYLPNQAAGRFHAVAGLARLGPPNRFDVHRALRPLSRWRAVRRQASLY